jgi:ABC-type Fe3+/spermidine/putrescine transport system ATPase subunit
MPALEVIEVSKAYGELSAVRNVSLTVDRGELVCLLGPSGCGKTTLLRLIAGLDPLDAGTIAFDGKDLRGVASHARGFGLMFQDLALFPHMDVLGNVGFGLRMQHLSGGEVLRRVEELLELVELAGFGKRKVHELSGGERQRVALARSLAPAPKLLMLDEPLGSLDRALRESLQTEVRSILKAVGVTAIYVTHDRDEAFAIADTIAVMDRGSLVQAGPPEALFRAPANELVARSLGVKNIIPGKLVQAQDPVKVECSLGTLVVGGPVSVGAPLGGDVLALIDERGLFVGPTDGSPRPTGTVLTGVVKAQEFRGGESELHIGFNEGALVCVVPSPGAGAGAGAGARVGEGVTVVIPPEAVRLSPRGEQPASRVQAPAP